MKKKKILASSLLGISILAAGITLTSCDMSVSPSYETPSTTTKAPKPTTTTTSKPTTTSTTVQKVTVTFNSNGGSAVTVQTINKGGKVTQPTNPTKQSSTEGNKTTTYTFGGWYSDSALTKAFDFNTVVNANTTLYAKWNATITEELTVTFNTMGGSSIQQQKVIKGNKVARPTTDPTKNATAQFTYSFAGWYKDQAYTTVFDFANEVINANTTIYAKWTEITNKYDVTWKNGDTVLKTEKVAYGKTPVYSGSTPTKAADVQYSYTFIGWTPEVDAVTKAITYTATFKETTNKYKVTWLNYDGNQLDVDDVEYNQTPEYFGAVPLKPSDEQYDYTFIAWTPTISKVTGDVTYIATFTETLREYTVTFYNGDDEFDVQTVEYGSKPTTPDVSVNTPTKASTVEKQYTFAGWALTPDGPVVTEFDDVTGNVDYYAVFIEEDKVYTVKFNNYDGSKFADDTTWTYGQGYPTFPVAIPTKPSDDTYRYEFLHWDAAEPTASSTVIVCTPTFTEIKIFDVTYNTMGANETLEAQTVDKDAYAIEPTVTLTKFASKFVGWYTSNDNGQTLSQDAYDFATPVTGALTLYAKWEELTKATVATTVNIGESEDYKAPVFDGNYYIPQIASKASTDTIYTLIKTDDTVIVHDADKGDTAYAYLTQGINITSGYLQVTTEFSVANTGSKWNIVNLVNSSGSTVFSIGLENSNKFFSYSLNGNGKYLNKDEDLYVSPDSLNNKIIAQKNTKYKAIIDIDFENKTISYSIDGKNIVKNVVIDDLSSIQAIMFQTATTADDRDITITELHSDYANEDLADIKTDVIASINEFVEKLELDTYYTKNKDQVIALQTDYISNVNAATSNQEAILNYYYFYLFGLPTVYSDLQEMIINYETIIKDKLSTDYPNKTYEMSKDIEEEIDEYTTKRIYYGLMYELEDAVYSAKDKDEFDSIISTYENMFVAIADDVATIQSQYKTQKVNALKENYPETLYTINATAYNKVFEDLNTTLATLTVKSDIDGALNAAETILMSIEEDSYGLGKYKELVAYTNTEIDKLLINQKDKYAGSTYETEINGILSTAEVNIKLDEADYSDYEEYEEAVDEQFGNEKGNIDTKIAAIKAETEFTVTLKFNNGTDDSVSTVYVGDKIDAPTAPTKTGSTFKGWYTKNGTGGDWGTAWDFDNDTVTATTTLYARFDINQYEVTFDTNGAKETAPTKQTINYGAKVTNPGTAFTKDPTISNGEKTLYTFAGWYNGDTEYDFNTEVTAALTLKIKWTESYQYLVKFINGDDPEGTYVDEDATLTAPTAPTKTGYTFKGWYTKNGTGGDWGTAWDFDNDTVEDVTNLYARFDIDTYEVTFDTNGAKETAPAKQTIDYGSKATTPGNGFTKDKVNNEGVITKYTFAGWYNGDTEYDFNTEVTAALTLKIKWTESTAYEVTFVNNNGTNDTKVEVDKDAKATKPTNPTKTGYGFAGWYTKDGSNDDWGTAWNFENNTITAVTKLYAKYDIDKFDVKFDTDGANEAAPQQQNVDYNGKVTAPTGTFTKDDKYEDGIRTTYTFAGWYNGDVKYDFNAAVTSALTLKIKWTKAYTYDVTFNAMGATQKLPQVQYIDNNGLVTKPQDPAKYGYVLDGWFTKDGTNDDWGTEWNFASDKITAVTTLYAKWTLEEKYTVTFDSMGGSPITNQIVIAGNPASEPVDPTKDNNKFIGWYTSDDEGQTLSDNPYDFAELVTGDLTLYAKWTQTTRKVIFYVGDDEYETIDNVEYGTVIDENDLPADPDHTLTGYTFAGWYTDQELTHSFNVKYDEVICDELEFNLYAKFRLSKYQVTFDTDGGSTISSQRVEYGKSAAKPQDPTKDGFTFAGWYNYGLTEEYDFAAPITGATTIYAKWEVK